MQIKVILNKIYSYIKWMKILWHPFGKTAYLLATPTHDNIGDLAIVVAEEKFLKYCGYDRIINIVMSDCWEYPKCIARLIPHNSPVYFNGGGNMGDIYLDEQLRRTLLPLLKKHEVVLFPQTIFYRNTVEGNDKKASSIQYYNQKNITIAAREQKSFQIMKNLYPEATILLTPDIVLSMEVQNFGKERNGILLCFRDDQEKSVSNESIDELQRCLETKGYSIEKTSMIYYRHITAGMWGHVVRGKMEQIASARLFITDRLHGMIFAALTQTPCIVFGNNHHKVSGVYKWIDTLDYISLVSSVNEAIMLADKMYNSKDCKFQFNMGLFDEFKKMIQEKGGLD